MVAELSPTDHCALAVEIVSAYMWHTRRNKQRAIERAAERERADERIRAAEEQRAARVRLSASPDESFQAVYDNPLALYQRGEPGEWFFFNKKKRAEFRKWCGKERFGEWLERAEPLVREHCDRDRYEMFQADWHPGGVMDWYHERAAQQMTALIEQIAAETRLEVTAELLGSEFALGDGRRVTWGEATIADHEQRIAMVTANAVANAEDAARHQAAVSLLKERGLDTLAEIASAEVAA